ncbi:RNA helicase [Rhodonellum psychrophilum GCM71 = DSM 17998]|jgi:ATP-dependent RNA helicase DeaD|uniref:DEAD-box ATP-dependent RNA helicase RhpA n=2 Tax=Rhodonellum TaxID=336827 RepID=U5BLP8_9BACT|nr:MULTISPECIES: DEAD/DEAH box helicase [Rhodonellum]ERM81395.1 RNA helicase [Rhodonellum psychrophilum GCM71 = DSM 17998]MDO9554690.1 DEAD/DEAH box helicase [Rhodonellum sp.]SDZ56636.1 ATP-dependent RNA helicase DeaD [Rhodonellum ikkaensis]
MEQELLFSDLGISDEILKAVEDMGYTHPSPIQAQTIPFLLAGHDVIGQAQTGTGKTAAFGIPIIDLVDASINKPQALILCPTRELAVQVEGEIVKLSRHKRGISSTCIYGGEAIDRQIRSLRKGVQIVVGTPGRIMDHMERRTLNLDHVSLIVLDEADEMLDMGFREDIETILSEMPKERQTVFFSATMPKPILDLTRKFQTNPEIVKVLRKELTVENVSQAYYEVKPSLRIELMTRLMNLNQFKLSVVFCNTKRATDEVTEALISKGIMAEALHGDLSQAQRTKVMNKFRKGSCSVMVATDVAARGIDVENVEVVFNYDLPLDEENYVHRIGRTGRAGKSGMAISFVTGRKDTLRLKDLERFIKTTISRMDPPSVGDLVELKKAQMVKDVHRVLAKESDNTFFEETIGMILAEGVTMDQIALALIKMQMGDAVKHMKDQNFELEVGRDRERGGSGRREGGRDSRERDSGRGRDRFSRSDSRGDSRGGSSDSRGPRKERGPREQSEREPNMSRLFLSLGKKDRIRPNDIVGAIAGETGVPGRSIGGIDIFDNFSFVDVPSKDAEHVISVMRTNTIKGQSLTIEISKG